MKGASPINAAKTPGRPRSSHPLSDVRRCYVEEQYPMLVRNNRLRASDLTRLRNEASNFQYSPTLSILLPASNLEQEWLERGLDSLMNQVYPGWELCVCGYGSIGERTREVLERYERMEERVKVAYLDTEASMSGALNTSLSLASGEFITLLDCGDELAPNALFEVVRLLQEHPEADLIYSDTDEIDEKGNRSNPHFKPGWSPDLLLSTNYISRLGVYRKSLLEKAGAFREGFDGCEDYELVLRVTERTEKIYHVPKVLYHRRAAATNLLVSSSGDNGRLLGRSRRALAEALVRRGYEGSVEDGLLPGRFRTRLKIEATPKVSIIIPTKDNVSFLERCIESVERLTAYRNYEVLIVDNNSSDKATLKYLASTPHRVIPFREAFNFSRINNFAVSHAEGEYILLLNDDTEVISSGWLDAMLEHAQRPEVGAVGAKLLYPDGRIQHAGVIVGIGSFWEPGVAMHSYHFYPADSPGYAGTLATTTNYSAVTAACILFRKSLFEELGGFDEENLPIQFNDVDLCLRMRERGYYVAYTPHAELYHHESVSRGQWSGERSENLYMRKRWGAVMDKDPYYNPSFSRGYGDFNLRADLLRPKVLRREAEPKKEVPISWFDEPWEHQRYMRDQYRNARNSPRTALIPEKLLNASTKTSRLGNAKLGESSLLQRDEQFQSKSLRFRLVNYWMRKLESRRSLRVEQKGIRADQLIWMFGHSRTGSTWLSWMMAELENQERWHEPHVGLLFGSFVYERLKNNQKLLEDPSFIMGEPHRDVWLGSIRSFILEGATARYPELKEDQYLVVKEPNGSLGAPLLLEATPESRLIFLIRDPRDVIASRLDAFGEGSWTGQDRDYSTAEKLNAQTERLAKDYLKVVSKVQEAYEAHPGQKVLVRYEDLRHDTINTLKAMYETLEVEADDAQIGAAVVKHSWARVPEENKGKDKFFRKAQPGSWREDLTPEQIKLIQEITGPILTKYY